MDRRAVVVTMLVLSIGLTGCSAVSDAVDTSTVTEQRHPFAEETVTVAVSGTDRERALAAAGLAYWEENASRYAGFNVSFRVLGPDETPDGGTADVRIEFVETVTDCGDANYSAGCAPRLNASTRVDRPADVSIQRGLANGSTRLVVQHEAGHLLGLSHADSPQRVMRHERTLATLPQPNATERAVPWDDRALTVAVLNGSVPADERPAYREEVEYALAYVRDGANGTVPENVTVERVSDPETADIVVRPTDSAACRTDAGSCALIEGTDPDRDGAIETYTRVEILLVDVDTDATSWHVARQLLDALGASRDGFPAPLVDATYEERRGEWHG
ncbi:matrixin [Halomicroarcula limicola]|uniref:Matrixin n=1 Tax=Haloarcula limicola TaxID=1429915 RepID=A0A8J7YE01_9EURY|nr:matrixin family metalloprotease [Halomicroarcula limicola]MBV0925491.1 matrixin [Halomicroarcula limicola]